MEIEISCTGSQEISLDELKPFQGALKSISRKNLDRLKQRIIALGFSAPVFVWENEEVWNVLDGHQRIRALFELRDEGYDIPDIPVVTIDAEDEVRAREKLLSITSQYGDVDLDELSEWLDGFSEDVAQEIRISSGEVNIVDPDRAVFEETNVNLKPTNTVHVLLSMSQNTFFDVADMLKQIKATPGIEYEQSQN